MGTIKAEALLKLWKVEDLTVEQGLGHTLQHLVRLYQQVEQMTAQQHKLENAVAALNVSLANNVGQGASPNKRPAPKQREPYKA